MPSQDEAAKTFARSFVTVRLAVGTLGLLLPIVLGSVGYRLDHGDGHPRVRASLSEYNYSAVGEVFVAVLFTIAIFLFAYRFFERKSLENWLSILSGIAVLVVVLCPTARPDHPKTGELDTSIKLTAIQDWAPGDGEEGEQFVKDVHRGAASAFVVFIGLTSFIFGCRERDRRRENPYPRGRPRWKRLVFSWRWHFVFWLLIWGAGLYIFFATKGWLVPDSRTAAFWGEFVAFIAFGLSWLTKGAEREILFGDFEAPPDPGVAA